MEPTEAIEYLRKSGMTEQAIATAVGVRQSTINRIRNGVVQPAYGLGKALVDLAQAVLDGEAGAAANEEGPDPSRCPKAA